MSKYSDFYYTAEAQNSLPKLSTAGPNFPMDMTCERLILLNLSKKQPER